jgi:hypothetical protein
VSPNAVASAWNSPTFAPTASSIDFSTTPAPKAAAMGGGHGFTFIADGGLGIQHDPFFGETQMGFAYNVGAGWFITDKLAVMGRFKSNRVNFSDFEIVQTSGVAGGVIQYWASPKVAIEAGAGSGWWSDDNGDSDHGFGLIVGVQFVVFDRGAHHLLVGAEYIPVLTSDKVHNIAVTFAYQFFKRS